MDTKIIDTFQITDPQGLVVTLHQRVWNLITGTKGHIELRNRMEDVLHAITAPTIIQESASDPDSRVYYWLKPTTFGKHSNLYVVVVVKVDADSVTGHVRTAYLTARLGKGRLLWTGKK